MSAIRYSGRARIRVTYIDPVVGDHNPHGKYRCTITAEGTKQRAVVLFGATLEHGSGIGVDSPEAFDSAAHAALSFADDSSAEANEQFDSGTYAATNDTGWHIGRSPAKAWPKGD